MDTVYLPKVGDPNAPTVPSARTDTMDPSALTSRIRAQQVLLPAYTYGLYQAVVTTNFDARLFENGTRPTTHGWTTRIPITLMPRPDLQVTQVVSPARPIPARRSPSISPSSTRATRPPRPRTGPKGLAVARPDDQLRRHPHRSPQPVGPRPGRELPDDYQHGRHPPRFRGTVYLLVQTDAGGQVDEFPNDGNNTTSPSCSSGRSPCPTWSWAASCAPAQVVEGATTEVRYTVTNLGPRDDQGRGLDRHGLAHDRQEPARTRPGRHPAQVPAAPRHALANARATTWSPRCSPAHLVSGTYYFMPWTDPYDVVLEDTLAVNVNPDDPNEIDNNNYKAGTSIARHTGGRPPAQAGPDRHVGHAADVGPGGTPYHRQLDGQEHGRRPRPTAPGRRGLVDRRPERRSDARQSLLLGEVHARRRA